MASTYSQLDLDLCRKILLRTEEVMGRNRAQVARELRIRGIWSRNDRIQYPKIARQRTDHAQGSGRKKEGASSTAGPKRLYAKGLAFLDAAREEAVWIEALKQLEERGVQPTLKRVKRILLENARSVI